VRGPVAGRAMQSCTERGDAGSLDLCYYCGDDLTLGEEKACEDGEWITVDEEPVDCS
jgi:hypothetical protein